MRDQIFHARHGILDRPPTRTMTPRYRLNFEVGAEKLRPSKDNGFRFNLGKSCSREFSILMETPAEKRCALPLPVRAFTPVFGGLWGEGWGEGLQPQ